MDLTILVGIAIACLVILITLYILQKRSEAKEQQQHQHIRQQPQQLVRPEGLNRRAQIARNQRNRLRQNAPPAGFAVAANEERQANANANSGSESDSDEDSLNAFNEEKMGAKKRAKMEAKEQKRKLREQELKLREEKKVKEAKEQEQRKKQEDLEAEEERKKEEAERLAIEEKERKEYEEYLKLKATFSVEEEGYGEEDVDEKTNLLADFIKYIKDNKAVVLEDIAVEFKLKTQQVIDRIHELQEDGTLTGVIDDRGKFIYVSEDELASVAKFIKQRGRVSIAELAESSNKLINLTPVVGS